ncbi:sugar dehydrogenase complex small subunit [Bordetella hinzii]|uniref:sugar dehydrogenase complex small subunit n=1 Tax=Bordetella hinzii TaxID=103855 RepID=UPI002A18BA2A|nr:sugar dehydrogenase complex small subunit [Bordetella hinzii]WPL81859.1 sugar dehydrogenase complex small subunit [Bordetella hinzii]
MELPDIPSGVPQARPRPSRQRRALLLGLASVCVQTCLPGVAPAAPVADSAFLALSRVLTDRQHLNPLTASRIQAALAGSGVRQAARLPELIALAASAADSAQLMQAARQAGLQDLAGDIVAAWYTGTVGSGPAAVLVAYEEALMYQPVRDALTVPTYCSYGPMWWTAAPPDAAAMPPEPPLLPTSKAL